NNNDKLQVVTEDYPLPESATPFAEKLMESVEKLKSLAPEIKEYAKEYAKTIAENITPMTSEDDKLYIVDNVKFIDKVKDKAKTAAITVVSFTPIGTIKDIKEAEGLADKTWAAAGLIPAGKAIQKAGQGVKAIGRMFGIGGKEKKAEKIAKNTKKSEKKSKKQANNDGTKNSKKSAEKSQKQESTNNAKNTAIGAKNREKSAGKVADSPKTHPITSEGKANAATYPQLKEDLKQQNLDNIAAQDPRLAKAVQGSGNENPNFSIGSGTRAEADQLGQIWVGDGAKLNSKGNGLISADGTRAYRFPAEKPNTPSKYNPTGTQANFESYEYQTIPQTDRHGNIITNPDGTPIFKEVKPITGNGHLIITD
ncbi:MAG: hypothetical protein IJ566_05690, partial [Cardiobacteriaceae bacterium]|nr:hypothetical protein [Cardiobacteriaceae bacterium]